MDFPVTHWAPFPRQFRGLFPIDSAAFIQRKDHWMRQAFKSCNFSLVLRGRGEFHRKGRLWSVEGPCVITQWPGEHVEYGPALPDGTWDEFYLIYDSSLFAAFKKAGFIRAEKPVWSIEDPATVLRRLEEMRDLARAPHPERNADRYDLLGQLLLMETLLPSPQRGRGSMENIALEMARDPARPFDLLKTASKLGLSESTFRRRWKETMGGSPHHHLLDLRLRLACRLLAESRDPINEIARRCGFEDELYFSRRFRLQMRMSPREYRRIYQVRRGL